MTSTDLGSRTHTSTDVAEVVAARLTAGLMGGQQRVEHELIEHMTAQARPGIRVRQVEVGCIGVGWIGSGLFLAPAIAGGREARGQGVLVDLLFYVTLIVVASPVMLVGLAVGVAISLLQALTQIQEMTIAFVPKILAIFLSLLIYATMRDTKHNSAMHRHE